MGNKKTIILQWLPCQTAIFQINGLRAFRVEDTTFLFDRVTATVYYPSEHLKC